MTNILQRDTTQQIEPCPFCGHKPNMSDPDTCYPTGHYWRYDAEVECRIYVSQAEMIEGDGRVYCLNCVGTSGGCGVQMLGDSKEDVIAKWNNREHIEALLEAQRAEYEARIDANRRQVWLEAANYIDAVGADWQNSGGSIERSAADYLSGQLRRMALEPTGVDKGEKE
jgi:hypothetical protein